MLYGNNISWNYFCRFSFRIFLRCAAASVCATFHSMMHQTAWPYISFRLLHIFRLTQIIYGLVWQCGIADIKSDKNDLLYRPSLVHQTSCCIALWEWDGESVCGLCARSSRANVLRMWLCICGNSCDFHESSLPFRQHLDCLEIITFWKRAKNARCVHQYLIAGTFFAGTASSGRTRKVGAHRTPNFFFAEKLLLLAECSFYIVHLVFHALRSSSVPKWFCVGIHKEPSAACRSIPFGAGGAHTQHGIGCNFSWL